VTFLSKIGWRRALFDELVAKAGEFELAEPPEALERYRRKLRENTYKVLVVGEAKRARAPLSTP
jgi:hypothetical protein